MGTTMAPSRDRRRQRGPHRPWLAAAAASLAWSVGASSADAPPNAPSHRDMFNCAKQKVRCSVVELTDDNWQRKLDEMPMYIMLYAPWCANCKKLVPDLKRIASKLRKLGLGVGAVNVEPNPAVQKTFRPTAFPHLMFCPTFDPTTCITHLEPSTDTMYEWILEMAVDELMLLDDRFDEAAAAYAELKELRKDFETYPTVKRPNPDL
mmetsp:Transcript_16187/g.65428  ORF Transcript_16187/g.65428 Transcript_16187/m.65428 type:complete len:207 (+) Transcript_16187:93-713(+)